MIRQAHTYLVGALSGVVVIGIAIAAFVVLVSAQVFHDLPIPALSGSDQKAASVSQGKAVAGSPEHQAVATTGTAQPGQAAANANAANGTRAGATNPHPPARHQATPVTPAQDATAPAEVVETTPSDSSGRGDRGSSTAGGNSGSPSPPPSSESHAPSSSPNPGSAGGGNATSTSGPSSSSGGSGSGGSTSTSGSSGGAPATGTSGGGPTTTAPPATPVTTGKPSEVVTEGVNNVVGTVDEAVGGTLSESGVTKVTEEVVNGVAGPESVVGKTIDGISEVVGGLVGGHGR